MRPLRLSFGSVSQCRPRHARLAGGLVFALATGAALVTAIQAVELQRGIDGIRGSRRAIESSAMPVATAPRTDVGAPTREQIAAVNVAITRLNLPWPSMLDEIERAGTRDVSLVAIEPDVRRGVVHLLGEAASADGLVDYVSVLSGRPAFSSVVILKHRMAEVGAGKASAGAAVEFTLELTWRDAAVEKMR